MLRLGDNPSIKYPREAALDSLPGLWYVAHTRPRHEKALARDLARLGLPYFSPLVPRDTIVRGRQFRSLVPLFNGYVFFKSDEPDSRPVMTTNHVASVLDVFDQVQLEAELLQIEQALDRKGELGLYPSVQMGHRFRVRCGPFAGLEGTVIRRQGAARLLLAVGMLGQSASLEIAATLLEPAER